METATASVRRSPLRCLLAALVLAVPSTVAASNGVCDSNPPTSTTACLAAMQSAGVVMNDIFRDSGGRFATQLPVYGQLFNPWPGCTTANFRGCSGQSLPPYDCPAQYMCTGAAGTFANASTRSSALDRQWWQSCRLQNHTVVGSCPDWTCLANGVAGGYFPWEGLVFDLRAFSNRVAVFGELEHGPQPCESVEFTVYLTDTPSSRETVQQPGVVGVDPTKWNRASLTGLFTKGWVEIRPPDPFGAQGMVCGDSAAYSVEMDGMTQVFSLPAGAALRYAAVVSGNDGLDFPQCAYDTSQTALDAVAGLTESGAGVCPDVDWDGFPGCDCPGAPFLCDCDDNDPMVDTCRIFVDGFESGNASAWSAEPP